jgi:dienelactone hydrolase
MLDSIPHSRRDCLTFLGAAVLLAPVRATAQAPALAPLNRFPRMVQEHFVTRVREAEAIGAKRRAALKTKADAEAYVLDVRKRIADCFGPFPAKSPLNARVTGTVARDTYVIEKVLFESRPGFLVSANLYIPNGIRSPRPGVVGSCGHSANGKAAEAYQAFAQGLARQGYVTLIFDPIGQGERLQYSHIDVKHRPRVGVGEHLHAGNQQFLVGEFFGSWRAWDGIRALDYLLSRKEVDPKRIGITGNSGGGTMSTWLCGVEGRWTMAAPSCFVTTFRRNLENELPADTEQCPPRVLAHGLDHADFLAALAPKPVVILAKEQDFFDVRGSEEAFARLKALYKLLGAEENIKLFTGPTDHGYSIENREAMYQWFNAVTKQSDEMAEPKLTIEKDETLYCAPNGQVAELKSRTVFSFTVERSRELARRRPKHDAVTLAKALRQALKMSEPKGVPDYRILRGISGRKYPKPTASVYAVETEPNVFGVVYRLAEKRLDSRPSRSKEPAILYVSHHSADGELRDEPLISEVAKAEPNATIYALDVRGIGESRPDTCGANQFLVPYGSDYFYAIHSIMLDRPYVGQKTLDVLRVLDWISQFGHTEVHLVAKGWGTIPGVFAAVLSDRVKRVTLKNAMESYTALAESEEYSWPLSVMVPDALATFDLPDCYRLLESRNLRMIESKGANG